MTFVIPMEKAVAMFWSLSAASMVGPRKLSGNGTPSVIIMTTFSTSSRSPSLPTNTLVSASMRARWVLVVPPLYGKLVISRRTESCPDS